MLLIPGPAWGDGVVPFGMEVVADDVQRRHLGVADLDALLVDAGIEGALDLQSGFCGRRADQLDDGEAIGQGPAAPVLRDVAEHAMLSSRAGEFHPHALLEPYVSLSTHTAPDVRPATYRNSQWAKRFGLARTTRANQSLAPLGRGRRRLNLLRAQRIKKASIRRNVQESADL